MIFRLRIGDRGLRIELSRCAADRGDEIGETTVGVRRVFAGFLRLLAEEMEAREFLAASFVVNGLLLLEVASCEEDGTAGRVPGR